jgi:hypothetical protein
MWIAIPLPRKWRSKYGGDGRTNTPVLQDSGDTTAAFLVASTGLRSWIIVSQSAEEDERASAIFSRCVWSATDQRAMRSMRLGGDERGEVSFNDSLRRGTWDLKPFSNLTRT